MARDDGIVGWRPQVEKANICWQTNLLASRNEVLRDSTVQTIAGCLFAMAKLIGMFWKDCSKNTSYRVYSLLHFVWCGFSEEEVHQAYQKTSRAKEMFFKNVFLVSHLEKKTRQVAASFVWILWCLEESDSEAPVCSAAVQPPFVPFWKKMQRQRTKRFHV